MWLLTVHDSEQLEGRYVGNCIFLDNNRKNRLEKTTHRARETAPFSTSVHIILSVYTICPPKNDVIAKVKDFTLRLILTDPWAEQYIKGTRARCYNRQYNGIAPNA